MKPIPMMPLAGMDNASEDDDELQVRGQATRTYLRDAVNVDITATCRAKMRKGAAKVSDTVFHSLWQSPLHRDVFARVADKWAKVDMQDYTHQDLLTIGEGELWHIVLNLDVVVAGPAGLFRYNGNNAQPLTIDTPPAPMVAAGAGSLEPGAYGVALSWVRGSVESAVSPITQCNVGAAASLEITLPLCFDPTVTHARLYLTRQNGGELLRGEDYAISTPLVELPLLPKLGAAPQFARMEAMPSGKYLGYWRGRLIVAQGNVLRFSEAMAYHIHDPLHGFVQLPQRITFVQPVDSGLWVGQVTHVVFLAGTSPADLQVSRKTSQAPVPGSAIALDAEAAGQFSGGGGAAVAWLAGNGYVLGTPDGTVSEPHALRLRGISGNRGTSIVFSKRITTVVT